MLSEVRKNITVRWGSAEFLCCSEISELLTMIICCFSMELETLLKIQKRRHNGVIENMDLGQEG